MVFRSNELLCYPQLPTGIDCALYKTSLLTRKLNSLFHVQLPGKRASAVPSHLVAIESNSKQLKELLGVNKVNN